MKSGWEKLPFEKVIADVSGGNVKTPQSEFLSEGRFAIVDQGKELISGYVNEKNRLCHADLPVIIFGDHTRCFKYVDFPFCMGADGVKVLRPTVEAEVKYLYYYLRQLPITDGGYSRHYKYLKRYDVILPPLEEQKRIAAILDRGEALRAKRRAALAQLDELTQSIFIDMFGDPATNPKGWSRKPLGELSSKFSDGPFGSNIKSSHYTENGIRVVRLQNIGVGEFIDDDKAYVSEEHFAELKKHECLPGDVLIGTLGNPNLRACIQPEWLNVALNKADCVQFRPDKRIVNAPYICSLLNQPATEEMAQDLILGQTRLRISMGRLRGLEVPLPSLPLQQEFARRLLAIEKLKAVHKASLAELDELFTSLQYRAFRGEL